MPILLNHNTPPLEVSFSANSGECDWATVTEQRLQQQYSDMIIKKIEDQDTKIEDQDTKLKFYVEFKSGETDESVVRNRFNEFLRRTRSMKIWDLEIKPTKRS